MDMPAILRVMLPHVNKLFDAMDGGGPVQELNKDEINAELARLPDKPKEDLR
jgi:hypothetical protein